MRTSQSHSTYQGRYQAYNDSYLYRFTQPDTLTQGGPQGLNRYTYVGNNSINRIDPTGHREISPCDELAGGCDITDRVIERDLADAAYFEQRTDSLRCQSGETEYCSYAENHPVDTALSFVGGLVGIAGIDVFLFGGGAATLVDAGIYDAGFACLKLKLCRVLIGLEALFLPPKQTRPNPQIIGQQGVDRAASVLPIDTTQTFIPGFPRNRIYDGFFINSPTSLLEIKTSIRGVVYATRFNLTQIQFDSGSDVTWLFVNARPSMPLIQALRVAQIPWAQLHVP